MAHNSSEKSAAKMNEVRHMYLASCKTMCDALETLEITLKSSDKSFTPAISLGLKNLIDSRLENMRELATNTISSELENFLSTSMLLCSNGIDKKAKRFSKKVIEMLEASFKKEKYPSDSEKTRLANLCMISAKQVNNWFTNKRNRSKSYKNGFLTFEK